MGPVAIHFEITHSTSPPVCILWAIPSAYIAVSETMSHMALIFSPMFPATTAAMEAPPLLSAFYKDLMLAGRYSSLRAELDFGLDVHVHLSLVVCSAASIGFFRSRSVGSKAESSLHHKGPAAERRSVRT